VCVTDLLTTEGNTSSISTSHIGDRKKTGPVLSHETRTATLNPLSAGGGCYDIVWMRPLPLRRVGPRLFQFGLVSEFPSCVCSKTSDRRLANFF
jgi:hypothetical protein